MSQNAASRITRDAWEETSGVPGITARQPDTVIPLNSDASNAIVQCLLIAARRGRQIRLAREQAAQRQQSESVSVSEETPQPDEA